MNKLFLVIVVLGLAYLGFNAALEGVENITHTQQQKHQLIEEMTK